MALPDARYQAQWLWINRHPNRRAVCTHRVATEDKLKGLYNSAEAWVFTECKGYFFSDDEAFYFSDEDSALHFRMRWT